MQFETQAKLADLDIPAILADTPTGIDLVVISVDNAVGVFLRASLLEACESLPERTRPEWPRLGVDRYFRRHCVCRHAEITDAGLLRTTGDCARLARGWYEIRGSDSMVRLGAADIAAMREFVAAVRRETARLRTVKVEGY